MSLNAEIVLGPKEFAMKNVYSENNNLNILYLLQNYDLY